MKAKFYNLAANKTDNDTLQLYIHDEIGFWGTDSETLINVFQQAGKVSTIEIDINSIGGSAFEALSIYNLLRIHPAKVNVTVSGVAASSASLIAMAGDTINMPDNAFMMIHRPTVKIDGNSDDLKRAVDVLDKLHESILNTYLHRAGIENKDKINELINNETYLTAKEAKVLNLIDNILDPVEGLEVENKLINNKQGVVNMADNKKPVTPDNKDNNELLAVSNRLEKAEQSLESYKNQIEESNKRVAELEKKNLELNNSLNRSSWERIVDSLITEGKVLPAEKEEIIENIEMRNSISAEKRDAYINKISEREIKLNVGTHQANKEFENAGTDIHEKVLKIKNEKGIPYHEAYAIVARGGE